MRVERHVPASWPAAKNDTDFPGIPRHPWSKHHVDVDVDVVVVVVVSEPSLLVDP